MSGLFDYAGKRVVLTGGTTGVGAAAVELLAAAGCTDLTVLDIKEPTGAATRFLPTDMSDPASIDAAIAAIGDGVDVLFNNAGVAGVHPADFVIRVNYLGVRRLTEGLSPACLAAAPS
ncbi:MAG: SDR family NAD(P)-dependent oxidoreductase [Acidimicrobiales bacterium]